MLKPSSRPASPRPVNNKQRIGDAVAIAERPRALADLLIDRVPEIAAGLLGGGGDILYGAGI